MLNSISKIFINLFNLIINKSLIADFLSVAFNFHGNLFHHNKSVILYFADFGVQNQDFFRVV